MIIPVVMKAAGIEMIVIGGIAWTRMAGKERDKRNRWLHISAKGESTERSYADLRAYFLTLVGTHEFETHGDTLNIRKKKPNSHKLARVGVYLKQFGSPLGEMGTGILLSAEQMGRTNDIILKMLNASLARRARFARTRGSVR